MNTLKEKFEEIIICNEIEGCSKQSDDCVKIANQYAIRFTLWLVLNKPIFGDKKLKELLEMFNEETDF